MLPSVTVRIINLIKYLLIFFREREKKNDLKLFIRGNHGIVDYVSVIILTITIHMLHPYRNGFNIGASHKFGLYSGSVGLLYLQ